jgi:ribosomal protein L37AE/L43A
VALRLGLRAKRNSGGFGRTIHVTTRTKVAMRLESQRSNSICPVCQSDAAYRSQMRGFVERRLLRPVGIRAFRCEACDARFYKFSGGHSESPRDIGSAKRDR